jgi:hypothetical protein
MIFHKESEMKKRENNTTGNAMKQAAVAQRQPAFLRGGMLVVLALLVGQFIAGMLINFYTKLPDSHPGTQGSYAPSIPWALGGRGGVALAIHVGIAILLLLGSIALFVRAIVSRRKAMIVGMSVGLFFILAAFSNGLTFLNRGGNDTESLGMSLAFVFALITYGVTFYVTQEKPA